MPSWTARLNLGSPQSSRPPPQPRSQGLRSPTHEEPGWKPQDTRLHGVPPLASTISPADSRRGSEQTATHGRSRSTPFSTIYKPGNVAPKLNGSYDSFSGHNALPDGSRSNDQMQDIEKDFAKGSCATCDTHVRWPRNLDTFRCTICIMINDLKPTSGGSSESRVEGSSLSKTSSSSQASCFRGEPECQVAFYSANAASVPFVSTERTLKLIDECIDHYLPIRLQQISSTRSQAPKCFHQPESLAPPLPSSESLDGSSQENTSAASQANHKILSPTRAPPPPPDVTSPARSNPVPPDRPREPFDSQRAIFRPLENYILSCFSGADCLNASFLTSKPPPLMRTMSESAAVESILESKNENLFDPSSPLPELDAKALLRDYAENGTWGAYKGKTGRQQTYQDGPRPNEDNLYEKVISKSPCINWQELSNWYSLLFSVGVSWKNQLVQMEKANPDSPNLPSSEVCQQIEEELSEARAHVQQTVLKASELLLKRPGRPLQKPEDCRFLLLLLANPLLHSPETSLPVQVSVKREKPLPMGSQSSNLKPPPLSSKRPSSSNRWSQSAGGATGRHSGIIKRILGLLSTLSVECHQHLISWFSRFEESHFRQLVELIGSFVSYRLCRQHGRRRSYTQDPSGFMIPNLSGPGAGTSAHLHAALGASTATKSPEKTSNHIDYTDDWQIRAAARIMSLLFSANNNDPPVKSDGSKLFSSTDSGKNRPGSTVKKRAHRHGQLLPTSAFYNTMLDYANLIADFEVWESRKPGKFAFCQYPMFFSIWAKIQIMEYDARRQMETMARDAFFNSIISRKAVNQYLVLKVRRDCLVEDSLRGVSEVVGTGQEEIKKGLRIEFIGEEGLDSGGLRKEWFLLLVREIFDPEHGLFVYDEDSKYCYFNPNTFETSDQFFLVGVLLGLALYNSTILDVALPPFAFRKLLSSARYTGPNTSSPRPMSACSLDDLAEFRPALAQGLRQLLDFEGDVEATFCQDFIAAVERYGQSTVVPLCPNGDQRPVTNANRQEFVDLYVRYLLDSSVARQYEPFKRGFFTVCGGNALSLFRPEEVELLVRGSEEPLDVATLRAVATYENWGKGVNAANESVVIWFWEAFANATANNQRKLLSFITASDRIPAMGATNLVIKIMCLGDHQERFPIARTCFNMIALFKYQQRARLEKKLWRAVLDSEGFGMK